MTHPAWLGTIVALSVLIASPVNAASLEDYDLSAKVSYAVATDTGEHVQRALSLEAAATVRTSETFLWQLGARAWYDFAQLLRPNRDDERFFPYANEFNRRPGIGSRGDIELRDFYFEWQRGQIRVRVGRQQVLWNSLDGISVFVINPSDFHEFVLNDDADRQRPQWGMYVDIPMAAWRFEGAAFLDSSVHDVPDPGSWFEFKAPQFRFGLPSEQETGAIEIETRLPDTFDDVTYALRASRTFGNTNLVFAGLIGNEYEAVAEPGPSDGGPALIRNFPRRRLAKVALETGLGPAVLRGELVTQFDRVLNMREEGILTTTAVDTLTLGIGTDLDLPYNVFMNLQFLLERVRDAPETLIKPSQNDLATITLQRPFFYDALTVKWRWYRDMEFGDSLSQVSMSYSPSDATTVELLGARFAGSSQGRFGQFDARDLVKLTLRYSF